MTLMNRILHLFQKKKRKIESFNSISQSIKSSEEADQQKKAMPQNKLSFDQTKENSESEQYEVIEREIMPEKIICPDCGQMTLEGLEYCDKCGGDLTNY